MNHQQISPAELEEMEKRCEAATPGPWDPSAAFDRFNPGYIFPQYFTGKFEHDWTKNLCFIAYARTDLPRLISSYRAEVERRERLEKAVREVADWLTALENGDRLYDGTKPEWVIGMRLDIDKQVAKLSAALEGK